MDLRAGAVVQDAEFVDVLIDAGESAKSLHRPGMARLLALIDASAVDTGIIAKLDRLTVRAMSVTRPGARRIVARRPADRAPRHRRAARRD